MKVIIGLIGCILVGQKLNGRQKWLVVVSVVLFLFLSVGELMTKSFLAGAGNNY